jgi:release factor glutamine methyltransferase
MSDLEATITWAELVTEATARLKSVVGANRAQEARWIVERVSGYNATELHRHRNELVSTRSVAFFDALIARRVAGEPLQYVLGRWPFRTLELIVSPAVLIPRPETEHVAEFAVRAAIEAYADGRAPLVVDLGTGSGAIGLSVAVEVAAAQVWCTDVSDDALGVARANLAGLGRAGTRVTLAAGSWFDALPPDLAGDIDVLVSNPPYVEVDAPLDDVVKNWEPHLALFAPDDGFAFVAHLIDGAPRWLRPGGVLVLEMGEHHTDRALAAAEAAGLVDRQRITDLAGRPRGITARRPIVR